MDLNTIYQSEGFAGLSKLAEQAGCNPKYLYQCATGRKTLSPQLAKRLVECDSRLSFEALFGVRSNPVAS
jgi:hypothetical protein